ncbi:E3 ubiquitin-protein ligase BRE1A-like [Dermacentor silvarum]|uniref:E3 ubiquitin-protein ligase BRE1A-like n=1 Tax=Dermacentor silvarum TaxID=543639 RepID=UPI002100A47A|nr:E3 ubiquitin-protein ligase BRE1A-like [Dermacentor silvarum]
MTSSFVTSFKGTGHDIADELIHPSIERENGVSVLIGSDQLWAVMTGELSRPGNEETLIAMNSKLGWIFQGSTEHMSSKPVNSRVMNLQASQLSAEDKQLLSRLDLLQREVDKLTATVENLLKQRDHLLVERDSQARQLALLTEKLKEKDKDTQIAHFTCRATESLIDKLQVNLNSKESDVVRLTCRVRELEAEAASAAESHSHLLQENQRLHENFTLLAKEHKNMASDLENAVQQKRDFELQIQEYVIKVTKIEELLRTRDREKEDILDQYRSLISANADLLTLAEQSQKEQDSSDATLNSLRQQLARNMSVTTEQEQKLASLGATMAALQESLQHSAAERSRLKEELQKSTDMRARLVEQVESLQDQLAKEQTINNQISGHLRRLEEDLSPARTEVATARSDATSLEHLLATSREQRCQTDIALERLSTEMGNMKQEVQAGATSSGFDDESIEIAWEVVQETQERERQAREKERERQERERQERERESERSGNKVVNQIVNAADPTDMNTNVESGLSARAQCRLDDVVEGRPQECELSSSRSRPRMARVPLWVVDDLVVELEHNILSGEM